MNFSSKIRHFPPKLALIIFEVKQGWDLLGHNDVYF